MATRNDQRESARGKAEDLLSRSKQRETERLTNQEKERLAQDEKIARLRTLRLAKEATDKQSGPLQKIPPAKKRALPASTDAPH
jgi:hypothetical protein